MDGSVQAGTDTGDADATSPHSPALARFCQSAGRIASSAPASEVPARVAAILPYIISDPGLLNDAQRRVPESGYGRHVVHLCPNDLFSVLAVVWPAGIFSPIHDHETWCAFGVYEGVLEETHYLPADASSGCQTAIEKEMVRHLPGAVGHLPVDACNIHRMHNPTTEPVISIHVYGGNSEKQGPNVDRIYQVQP
jgi:predicted metal-dependent enzyme (double-stranded beta helix superfamily)